VFSSLKKSIATFVFSSSKTERKKTFVFSHSRGALNRAFENGTCNCLFQLNTLFAWLISHQPSVLFSEQTSHQQPASGTFLSEQISTSHQPPAKRTVSKIGVGSTS
jgi:hypothetical protein